MHSAALYRRASVTIHIVSPAEASLPCARRYHFGSSPERIARMCEVRKNFVVDLFRLAAVGQGARRLTKEQDEQREGREGARRTPARDTAPLPDFEPALRRPNVTTKPAAVLQAPYARRALLTACLDKSMRARHLCRRLPLLKTALLLPALNAILEQPALIPFLDRVITIMLLYIAVRVLQKIP